MTMRPPAVDLGVRRRRMHSESRKKGQIGRVLESAGGEKGLFTSKARCYVLQSFALPKLVTPHHIFFAALINQC